MGVFWVFYDIDRPTLVAQGHQTCDGNPQELQGKQVIRLLSADLWTQYQLDCHLARSFAGFWFQYIYTLCVMYIYVI